MKNELQAIRGKRLEGVIIRSRARWLRDGEKATHFFCNLENINFVNKSMKFIEKNNGNLISEQKEILNEVKGFYENLYKAQKIKTIDLNCEILDHPF
jgi:hypothetical protein